MPYRRSDLASRHSGTLSPTYSRLLQLGFDYAAIEAQTPNMPPCGKSEKAPIMVLFQKRTPRG
jgi:hypothetical protein